MKLWQHVSDYLSQGKNCILVLVSETKGSVPRHAGAGMVVLADGRFNGTIGGGALEWQAIRESRIMLSEKFEPCLGHSKMYPLGPGLGQCCGGSVTLSFELWQPNRLEEAKTLALVEMEGSFRTRRTRQADGTVKRQIDPSGDEKFGETRIPVAVFGAGHVGRALAMTLGLLPVDLALIDTRRDQFPSVLPGNVTPMLMTEPKEVLELLDARSSVFILTHSHQLDLAILDAALRHGFDFIGLIGSQTKRRRFEKLLLAGGLKADLAQKFVCPIGIDGVSSKQPSVIAAAVAAQILRENGHFLQD